MACIDPQPTSHRVAIGMYEQYAKHAACYYIDPFMVCDLHMFETHKQHQTAYHGNKCIAIRYPEVGSSDAQRTAEGFEYQLKDHRTHREDDTSED